MNTFPAIKIPVISLSPSTFSLAKLGIIFFIPSASVLHNQEREREREEGTGRCQNVSLNF